MKKAAIFVLTFAAFIAFILSACGAPKETVTLSYAAWNLGDSAKAGLEREMIDAFMKKHPNIRIKIDESFVKDYNAAMKASSAADAIPDIFMYAGNPQADTNGWCADITQIAEKDSEWAVIPAVLRDSATIKGRIIAVPVSMHFFGYFYNADLFAKRSVRLPEVGMSVEQFKRTIAEMTDISQGSIGLADESNIVEWYPAAMNQQFGWYSWDGGRFNLNSQDFKNGIKLAKSINANKQTFAPLSEAERKDLKGVNDWESWNAGAVALKFDGTWAAQDYSKLPFRVGFAGIPEGRTCIVPDYLFISKKCKNTEEAFHFIKYMSAFSREGFSKRLELAETKGLTVSTIPMLGDKRLVDKLFAYLKVDGIREVYDKLDKGSYVEGTKVLPGYLQARWEYSSGIRVGETASARIGDVITNTYRGNINIDDVADQLNSEANECVQIFPKPSAN